jgi:DNA-binding transcriptional LysR family regulator
VGEHIRFQRLLPGLQTVVFDTDELVLLVPADHALASATPVPFVQTLDYDFVALRLTSSLTRRLSAAAESAGRTLRIRVQVRGFDAMCRMIAAGLGIGILPRAGAAPHVAGMGLKLVRLTGLWTQRRLLLAMRDRESLSGPARAFVEMVEKRATAGNQKLRGKPRRA